MLNRWDVPQRAREHIAQQMPAAIEHYETRGKAGDRRATKRLLKLIKLVALIDLSNDVDDGLRRSPDSGPIGQ